MPNIKNGKFVIVGGAGLLGSHIGAQLLQDGAREVLLFDNLSLGSTENIEDILPDPRCSFVKGDLLRLNELFDPLDQADGVFLVAGFLSAPLRANPWMGIDVNIRGAQNVLEAARVKKVSKVVFSSSTGVYGKVGDEPNSENSPLRWQSLSPSLLLYNTSKVIGEALCRLYEQEHGIRFIALRYACLYGEKLHRRAIDATRLVDNYDRVRAGIRPIVEGDGTQVQDFVYIGDVARANLMAMQSHASGESLNIASGVDSSFNDLTKYLPEACGSSLQLEYRDDPTRAIKLIPEKKLCWNIGRAKEVIGWEPQVFPREGIQRLVTWLDQKRRA